MFKCLFGHLWKITSACLGHNDYYGVKTLVTSVVMKCERCGELKEKIVDGHHSFNLTERKSDG